MPHRAWFLEWFNSPYYYLLYENRNDEEANAFIQKLINYLKPPTNCLMFDIACGKGRHSKALAELGFDVTGLDISHKAIEAAKESESDHLHFFQHDMRLPFRINYFDYAFNFFTSFGYFRTQREHDNTIRTIAQSLKNGGIFVMDYLNVHYHEEHLEKKHNKKIGNVGFHLTKWHDEKHFYKQIQVEESGVVLKHLFTEKVAKFSLGDFNDMFAYQGLQIQEVFGNYQFGHYDVKKSPRLIMVAKKVRP